MRPEYFLPLDSAQPGTAIIRDAERGWLLFQNPTQIIESNSLDIVQSILEQAEGWANQGGYAVGFLAYEAGSAFEPQIQTNPPSWPTLAWFALYESEPKLFPELEPAGPDIKAKIDLATGSYEAYKQAFEQTKHALAEGSIYQANITFKLPIQSDHPPLHLFSSLCGVNPPPYATYIQGSEWHLVSLSPELFFSRNGDQIEMRPMKGTATSQGSKEEKKSTANHLRNDPKTIAENIMIVDMVRNDLGRIAEVGSIQTPKLLTVEEHRTVLQVTSTVTANYSGSTSDIIASTFPPASVTGAPKISACRHIAQQETEPRGVYCGAIGYLAPERKATFSVGIRTALFDHDGHNGDYGVGSGVVWDSELEAEYQECLAKAKVIESPAPEWAILESLPDRVSQAQLERHLQRLQVAADYFQVPCNLDHVLKALDLPRIPNPSGVGKLRLTLNSDGVAKVEHQDSLLPPGNLKACLAKRPIDSNEPKYRYKTTSRNHLQVHLTENPDCGEVILFNERGEVASFCNGNLIALIDSKWITPTVESGCLDGIGLWKFSQANQVDRRPIQVAELKKATQILLTNAVVGVREVTWSEPTRSV